MNPPSGIVTFLFTDIEGSTKLAQKFHDKLNASLHQHNLILREAIESNNGHVFRLIGDAFCSAFSETSDAIKASVEIQRKLGAALWDEAVITVRIGIHSGFVSWDGKNYDGYLTISRAERVMSAAYGEQILISDDAYQNLLNDESNEYFSVLDSGVSFADLGEKKLKDLVSPVRLHQVNAQGLRSDFPPLKTLDARPNNLPAQISNFIGRENDIKQISENLGTASLITLTGSGGSGKTRLALQAGAEVIDDFPDGVWFIELAQLNDGDLLAQVIGRTFGLDENSGDKPDEALISFLKKKEALLILDNCEHIIDASAELTEKLLARCPRLKIIATSREAMKISGERILKVDSLTTPDPDEWATTESISQFEAVKLFIDRALNVDSKFQVNNDNAPALAEICHRLDGIPLAIELAAARIKVLPLEKINDRLSDRFKLLTGGKRTVLPRHQTLRAMIDWSYDHLNENEKLLFRRLSVFAGGWTLEAAEEICSDEYLESYDVIDILTGLLDKSLITSKEATENMRFGMLESIRQYAKEMAGDNSAIKEKHGEYYRKLTDTSEILEGKGDFVKWTKVVDMDIANIRRAIFRSLDGNPERAVAILNGISEYWASRGHFREGYITCKKILEFNELKDPVQRGMALYTLGHMACVLGNMKESRQLGNECMALFRSAGNKLGIANACNLIGFTLSSNVGHDDEAWEHYNEALEIHNELGSKYNRATVLYNMSFVAAKRSDSALSLKLKEEALEIYRETKNYPKIGMILTSLGSFEFKRGNLERAQKHIEESMSIAGSKENNFLTSLNFVLMGCINSGLGNFETAMKFFDDSTKISKECGYAANLVPTLYYIGDAFYKIGDYQEAKRNFIESVKTGAEKDINFYLVHNVIGLGLMHFTIGDFKNSLTELLIAKKILNGTYGTIGKPKADEADEYIAKSEAVLGIHESETIRSSVAKMSEEEMMERIVKS